jgi:hypothetical protein
MLRSFAISSRWNSHYRRTSVAFSLQRSNVLQHCLLPLSWFSTTEHEHRTILLTAEDAKKMLVVDLKNELKLRGVSTTGKKTELLERLTELLEKEKQDPTKDLTLRSDSEQQTERQRDLGNKRVENDVQEFPSTAEAQFSEEFQKLDLAVKQKNYLLFEETMKGMETAIRSKQQFTLSTEKEDSVAANLRAWNAMDGIPSESIASVLKSAGYIGLSVKNREVVEEIIEKYLKAKSKSTRSIVIFFTALNKVGMKWSDIKSEREKQILKLVNTLIRAEDLDVRSYCEMTVGLVSLGLYWDILSKELKRVGRAEELKPMMDIDSLDILVKAFRNFIPGKEKNNKMIPLDRSEIIFNLSLEGLKRVVSSDSLRALNTKEQTNVSCFLFVFFAS